MKNWKTTLAGIIAVGSTIIHYFAPQYATQWGTIVGLATGFGLIAAPDAKPEKESR